MKTNYRIYRIAAIALLILYCSSCRKADPDLSDPSYSQTVDLNTQTNRKANFKIKSNKITKTEKGYKFTGELLTQSNKGEMFALGMGDFELDTATDGSVKAIKGAAIAEFPDAGVFGEMLKTFVWKKVKAHIEYQPGQYYLDTYHTELPLDPDEWYLHFKPFDETTGELFELKQKLNSLVYHFADFYIDPLDPSILMKADISMPDDLLSSNTPGFAGTFMSHVSQGLNDNNPISFKAMMGISNQGLFHSKAYDFQMINKDFFKSKYGMTGFESASSNYFVKMDEPGIPVPYTDGMMNIVGEQYLHQPAILTKIGDFSQPSLLDYLNNTYQGGYMMNFNGKLRFGGNEYFSAILNGLGAINDVVGKDIFNTDLDLDLAQATLQIQVPGTVGGIGEVPSYFRFGGMTKVPLATDIFGEEIKKYIFAFPPPATQQFFYVSAGPSTDDCSIYLEGGARVHVPSFGDLDLGNAYFYVSLKGIEMGATSDIDAGPFHIDGDIKGNLSTKGFSLNMESNSGFTLNNIKFVNSHLNIKASSDSGLTFNGDVTLPYGLGNANIKGKFTNRKVSFAGELRAGTPLQLPNGLRLPTAGMKFSFDESNGFTLEGKVNVPHIGKVSVKGELSNGDFLLEGKLSSGNISFNNVRLPYASGTLTVSSKNGVNLTANVNVKPFGYFVMKGSIISSSEYYLKGSGDISLPVGGYNYNIASCNISAGSYKDFAGVSIDGKIDLYFTKMQVKGTYKGINNFSLYGSSSLEKDDLKLTVDATVTTSNIAMTATGTYKDAGVGIEIIPDWGNKSVKACFNFISHICIKL